MMTATKYLDFLSLYELLTETVSPQLLSPGLNRVFSLLSQVKPFFEQRHLELDAVPDSELGTGELAPPTLSNSRLDYISGIVPDIQEPLAVSGSLIKNVFQRFQIDTAEAETTSTPIVVTDKQDYQPGETATITATGFDPGAVVKLQVQHLEAGADGEFGTADDLILASSNSGSGHEPWVIKDGSPRDRDGLKNGTIITEWYVNPDDSANETFLLTATDLKTGEAAEPHIFTDSVLDLTQNQSAGFVNGAYIVRSDLASGAGTNDSFLQLKATPEEEGYNTDAAVSQPDVQSARSLQLSELPQVMIGGETFREVRLDLNEKNSASEITLQEFRLFLGNSATLSAYDPSNQTLIGALNNGQAVFDLGGSVLLDASLTPGTSSFDASIYVPETAFSGATGSTYVYLFSKLVSSDGGFEEFAVADVAGIDPEGTILGRVFEDLNGDGDDEAGADPNLDGVTVKLFLDDGDGVFEANEGAFDPTKDSLVTTTTSVNGSYSFGDVLAGDYFVRQVTPTDLIQTTTDPSLITIGSSTTVTGVDFGNVEEFGSISGQKFEDIDGDGVKDVDEAGLAGWTIFIDNDNDGVLDVGETSTTTDANGDYSFTDLTVGNYTIREVQQTGWQQTTTNPSAINITSGTDTTGVDFGNFQLGSISGQKFEDIDGDGVKDAGEAGLAGWTIFIDSDNDGVLDAGETSITTDSNGNYSFTDLTVGNYTIREVQQTGWVQKTANPAAILVESGTNATDVNFGNRQEADLQLVTTFPNTFKDQVKVVQYGETASFNLTASNLGVADAEYALITTPVDSKFIVDNVILPSGEGWIDLDQYDLDNDGVLDGIDADGDGTIDFQGDGNLQTIEILAPTLNSGASHTATVNGMIDNTNVVEFDIWAKLGGDNSALQEYSFASVKGTTYMHLNLTKAADSPIVEFHFENIFQTGTITSFSGSNVIDPNSLNNTSTDSSGISQQSYSGELGNGATFESVLIEQNPDPTISNVGTIINVDWDTGGGGDSTTGNNSEFLPPDTVGTGNINFFWDNKAALEADPEYFNTFLPLQADGDLTDPSDEQAVLDYLIKRIEAGDTANDLFGNGSITLNNGEESQTISVDEAQGSLALDGTDVFIVVKTDGVFFADSSGAVIDPTPIVATNDLEEALQTLPESSNPTEGLKIFIDSAVTETRLQSIGINAVADKGYLLQELEILGSSMTFNSQNGSADLDLSLVNMVAAPGTTITHQGENAQDFITGSNLSETIVGLNGADELAGGNGIDYLWGGNGTDKLRGDGGDDWLIGGGGADVLRGSYGNDILIGGDYDAETDTVLSDGVGDVFVLEENALLDTVRGYDVGKDEIGLLGINQADLTFTVQNSDTLISLNGEDLMLVEGVNNAADISFTTSFTTL